jgi:DNA excision repair protein ERCC-3
MFGVDGASDKPLIVQGDHTLLLEVDHPRHAEARDAIMPFSELVKSPEHVHTYRITPLSLWNAAAAGHDGVSVLGALEAFSRYPLPENVRVSILDHMARYGRLQLRSDGEGGLWLTADDPDLLTEVVRHRLVAPYVEERRGTRARVQATARGLLKQALIKAGHPVQDLAGYLRGSPLEVRLRERTRDAGLPFALRDYQTAAVDAFWAGGDSAGGSGVVCLPCGAGKTLVGLGAMARAGAHTLILCSSVSAARQWVEEILQRTHLTPREVGEYSGERKEIRPVTVATYQILTSRRDRERDDFPHMRLMAAADWGLVIYDEVHLLPAPLFRMTADIQARRRLGLTATLVREDGREDDVFALIGPKRYDVPWRELEAKGWIAAAECCEIRVDLEPERRRAYALAEAREQARLAAVNPVKDLVAVELAAMHREEGVLIIGQYLEQLERLAGRLGAPLVTGRTPQRERDRLFAAFRRGEVHTLVVSRVANFAIDLPEASVAVEVSGLFGSRQEEAQRLGRILRPKADGRPARFYALVSRDTREQEFAQRRQLFLVEQGYRYTIQAAVPRAADEGEGTARGPAAPAPSGRVIPFPSPAARRGRRGG